MMCHQVNNINKQLEIIKKNQVDSLEFEKIIKIIIIIKTHSRFLIADLNGQKKESTNFNLGQLKLYNLRKRKKNMKENEQRA